MWRMKFPNMGDKDTKTSYENSSAPGVGDDCDLPTLSAPPRLRGRVYHCFGCKYFSKDKDDVEKHTNEWCREFCQVCKKIRYIMIMDDEKVQILAAHDKKEAQSEEIKV
ncbi:hypothetical protein J437_LFUL013641 [Ladona fulva]|uniref:Uncharacterized protein n=1 Tax=Ladona fulva TaxID=123851 RepID=A0A8K0KJZ0_LADFU|nr:hypothetical protein J437_LFUL013641 [Ladona fulva]